MLWPRSSLLSWKCCWDFLFFYSLFFSGKFYSFLREFVTQSIVQRMRLCSVQSTKDCS
jgi:hypothetical protein